VQAVTYSFFSTLDHPRRILGRVKRKKACITSARTAVAENARKVIPAFASAPHNCRRGYRTGSRLPFSPCGCLRLGEARSSSRLKHLAPLTAGRTAAFAGQSGARRAKRELEFAPAFATGFQHAAAPHGWSSIVADHMSARLTLNFIVMTHPL